MHSWLIKLVVVGLVSLSLGQPVLASDRPCDNGKHEFVVTLLGTGSPQPSAKRFGMSTLVQAGDNYFLFDVGRGAMIRLQQVGVQRGELEAVFLTHLHSDHVVGLPDLFMTGWMLDAHELRGSVQPFTIYGPGPHKGKIGTKKTMQRIKAAFQADAQIRMQDEGLPFKGLKIDAHNIIPGIVYDKRGVKITAIPVNHGQYAKPAFAYRIDYYGRSVLLSGDKTYMGPGSRFWRAAKGVDVIVHEVFNAREKLMNTGLGKAVAAHHTLPREAGKLFSAAQPKLAVYSHIVLLGTGKVPPPPPPALRKKTREAYNGPLLIGKDLTSIKICRNDVTVIPPKLGLLPVAPGGNN